MVSYLQIEKLSKSIGDRMLFEDLTLGVFEGDKIGIIAPNGSGKTTFLNILSGKEDYDSGNVVFRNGIRVGYLEQVPEMDPDVNVLEYVSSGKGEDEDWSGPDKAKQLLSQFRITSYEKSMGELSGGEAKRVALARVLIGEPDMLILDEPTNHLDIWMIEWLEKYLTKQRVTLLMVTHDRYFLDNICTRIIEIDKGRVYSYEGNYDYYLSKRDERIENMSAELSRVRNLLRTEREWMRRQPQARGSKAKYRIDNFHELESRSRVDLSRKDVSLDIRSSYIGSKIFEAHEVTKSFGNKRILNGWSYTFARYEKVGIVGDNGVGKTTFIKMLVGELKPESGYFDVGETVRWGYYSQEGMKGFDERKKVIDAVREIAEEVSLDEKTRVSASAFLSRFLFSPATQQKYISKLSGGERRRLYLATVLMRQPNFLILDEPTNDLDIMTLAVLEDYLANFKGCLIVVSHDRYFLDRITDHLFVFRGDGEIRDFPGDYSTYRHCVEMEERERKEAGKESASNGGDLTGKGNSRRLQPAKVKLTYKENKEKEELEKKLPELEKERRELEERMSSGELTTEMLLQAGARIKELMEKIDESEFRLLELMEKEG